MYTIWVRMKKLGKKNRDAIEPVPYELSVKPETVQDLIIELTKQGVAAYNAREDKGQIVPHLTKEEIEDRASSGKVAFGLRGGNSADPDAAVENALQCFEDGIFRVFADDEELERLDQKIPWTEAADAGGEETTGVSGKETAGVSGKETSDAAQDLRGPVFTFVRLTMLTGW